VYFSVSVLRMSFWVYLALLLNNRLASTAGLKFVLSRINYSIILVWYTLTVYKRCSRRQRIKFCFCIKFQLLVCADYAVRVISGLSFALELYLNSFTVCKSCLRRQGIEFCSWNKFQFLLYINAVASSADWNIHHIVDLLLLTITPQSKLELPHCAKTYTVCITA